MSADEFLDELRRHQADDSWTFGHWVELERRGFGILDSDPELAAAVRAQYDRFTSAMREALAPIQEQMAERFKAIMPDLSGLLPKLDYSQFFPNTDFSRLFPEVDLSSLVPKYELDLPAFDVLPQRDLEEFVPPDFLNLHADSVLDHHDTIAALTDFQEDMWERENEVREAQLATAQAAAQQVEQLGQMEQRNEARHAELLGGYDKVAEEVRSGQLPKWAQWVGFGLAGVAAVAAVVAAIASV
jgi:hypothetical protein